MKKSNGLSLLNFTLVDQTKMPVNVALWGKQAESFEYSIGTILVMNSVRISNYGGLTLSVYRDSGFMEMSANYELENVEKLRTWWKNCWHMTDIQSNAYKLMRVQEESIRTKYERKNEDDDASNFKQYKKRSL